MPTRSVDIIHKYFIDFCQIMQKFVENTFMQSLQMPYFYQNVDRKKLSTKNKHFLWITYPPQHPTIIKNKAFSGIKCRNSPFSVDNS